ncbi:aminoglycoside phosphotransferase (APT) family kinase protein [Thermocatellispora tengchongensis]|uniref:Aminoglycoside phosphotransferase (APT) family kinase protein n=1 Tax=Thermocatellispora tengchongensis TaxID=1073253 RepID=A0A840PEI8_9ACTN|nr:aminoglycoside phosphotransferase family protein [Thermocatellispora tengchongensis]MBB5136353.1 aminoglycoside phosphotransferase (APT) family kinase protein [Thermocatellispora tengchongensis]
MEAEIEALVGRHLPGHGGASVVRAGEGLDNAVYEVDGELIVRVAKEEDPELRAEQVEREARLLAVVGELSSLPVPEVVFADPERGALAYRRLPGVPLQRNPVAEPVRLAAQLGEFLTGLHAAPPAEMEPLAPIDRYPMDEWLRDAERDFREIVGGEGGVRDEVPAEVWRAVEDFLGRTPPAEAGEVVFTHNDLGSEHLLVDVAANAITGVIDWTDAAVTDPAHDFGLILRDLGPEVFERTLACYGGRWCDSERERAVFYARCAILEDITFGLRTGERVYVQPNLVRLARSFQRNL